MLALYQVKEKKPEFFPREEACCFEAEDNPIHKKLESMQAEMTCLLRRFNAKDANKSVNAMKAEQKVWEESVLRPQQSVPIEAREDQK